MRKLIGIVDLSTGTIVNRRADTPTLDLPTDLDQVTGGVSVDPQRIVRYFAAGGAWEALSVYYDHMPNGFLRSRWLLHRPRLDMAYVFERIMVKEVPLDTDTLAASPFDVRIVLSDVDRMEPTIVSARDVASDIRSYLQAGSWLPILAGSPYLLNGGRYLDGGLLWPDPLYAALADDCTHILMLNTAAEGSVNPTSSLAVSVLYRVLNRWAAGLGDRHLESRSRWEVARAKLRTAHSVTLHGRAVLRLRPAAGSHTVQRLTMHRGALLDGARAGYTTIRSAFGKPMNGAYFAIVDRS